MKSSYTYIAWFTTALYFEVSFLPALAYSINQSPSKTISHSSETDQCNTLVDRTKTKRFFILRHGQTDANAGGMIQGSSDFSRLTDLGKEQARNVARKAFLLNTNADSNIKNIAATTDASIATPIKFDNIYVSPLTRAKETLETIRSTAVDVKSSVVIPSDGTVLGNLREIDFYDWEGRDKEYLQKNHPDSWIAWKAGDPENLIVPETKNDNNEVIHHRPLIELWERAAIVWEEIVEIEQQQSATNDAQMNKNNIENSGGEEQQISSYSTSLLVAHGSLGQALLGTAMGWDATYFRKYEFSNCGLVEIEWNGFDELNKNNGNGNKNATRWRWRWPDASDWM